MQGAEKYLKYNNNKTKQHRNQRKPPKSKQNPIRSKTKTQKKTKKNQKSNQIYDFSLSSCTIIVFVYLCFWSKCRDYSQAHGTHSHNASIMKETQTYAKRVSKYEIRDENRTQHQPDQQSIN